MHLKQTHAYAVTAAVKLAALPAGEWLTAQHLSASLKVRQPCLVTLLRQLTVAGIVEVEPAATFKYRLARAASKVTLLQVIEAIDGEIGQAIPVELPGLSKASAKAVKQSVASAVEALRERLQRISLAKLRAAKAA